MRQTSPSHRLLAARNSPTGVPSAAPNMSPSPIVTRYRKEYAITAEDRFTRSGDARWNLCHLIDRLAEPSPFGSSSLKVLHPSLVSKSTHSMGPRLTSQKKIRDALLALGTTLSDTKRMFGPKDQVDLVRHLIGTRDGLRRQSRERRALSQRHNEQERWQDRPQAHHQRRSPRRRLLVDHCRQRQGLFRAKPIQRLFSEQYHREEEHRRYGRCSVRRLRRQDR